MAKDTATLVAQHLVVTGRLLDDDPHQALLHARAAAALAGRVGAVREAVGLAAYAAGEWTEAIGELRTARRITGRADHLAVIADCERALGRPERALALWDDPDVPGMDQVARVELIIVVAGARRDLGERDAAVLLLQGPARATTSRRSWAARLWYAYADALLAAERTEAREWFAHVAEVDESGETDAVDRLLELDGVVFDNDDEQNGPDRADDLMSAADLAALVAPRERAPLARPEPEAEPKPGPEPAAKPEPQLEAKPEPEPEPVGEPAPVPPPAAVAAAPVSPSFSDEVEPPPPVAATGDSALGQQELFSDLGPA